LSGRPAQFERARLCAPRVHRLRRLGELIGGVFDVIVANPPYVASAEVETLAPEVRDHDPKLSLDGGEDGLAAYRAFVPSLRGLTAPDGLIALELGTGQAGDVTRLLASAGFARMEMHRDLAAHERVVTASRGP